MKEVVRADDPRLAALIARQATQYADDDQIGLNRISALLDALGRPQDRLPPVFHVAGTNGKGSTCAFLRAGLEAAGYRVHVFTSPHLVRYNERIRLAGKLISDAQLADVMSDVLDANDVIGGSLFEVNTAAAFLAFAETPADAWYWNRARRAARLHQWVGAIGQRDCTLGSSTSPSRRYACAIGREAGVAKIGIPLVSLAQSPGGSAIRKPPQ